MTFKEIENFCKEKEISLIEFTDIDCKNIVKNINDFLNICGNTIGYKYEFVDEDAATENLKEMFYKTFAASIPFNLREEAISWLQEKYDNSITKLCKQKEYEAIILYSLNQQVKWEDDEFLLTEENEKNFDEGINTYITEFLVIKEKENQKRKDDIDKLIESYKVKYSAAKLVKDKDSIIKELISKLSTKFNIDGRADPAYRKDILKLRLDGNENDAEE